MSILVGNLLSISSVIFICFICTSCTTTIAQPSFSVNKTLCDGTGGNYTSDDTFESNLDTAFADLETTNSGYGYYNHSVGQGMDKVNTVALCRGDVGTDVCRKCLGDCVHNLRHECPKQREAVRYDDNCLLHYSFNNIVKETKYRKWYYIRAEASAPLNAKALRPMVDELINKAAAGGPKLKFACGKKDAFYFSSIYPLVQCTPDLSKQECTDCLQSLMRWIQELIGDKVGGGIFVPMCNLRYDTKLFFNESLTAPPPNLQPSLPTSPPPGKKINTRFVVIGTVSVTVVVAIVIATLCIFLRLKKKKKETPPPRPLEPIESELMDEMESLHYSFDSVKAAANDFSEECMLGRGGFGEVYKGVLEDGREIAAKKHAENSNQGDVEFKNEVLLASELQHQNLVKLLGFSINGSERLLIYEFLPNASLDQFLSDPIKSKLLGWEKRLDIIKGIADGLLYLHEGSRIKIVHLDMKASNVLLDEHMDPKIADFGLAKQIKQNQNQGEMSQVAGTPGYMAPEYLYNGEYSEKSDVYSFGVLILEIITGENTRSLRNEEKIENISSYVWKSWNKGTARDIIDPTLEKEKESVDLLDQILRCINIGL